MTESVQKENKKRKKGKRKKSFRFYSFLLLYHSVFFPFPWGRLGIFFFHFILSDVDVFANWVLHFHLIIFSLRFSWNNIFKITANHFFYLGASNIFSFSETLIPKFISFENVKLSTYTCVRMCVCVCLYVCVCVIVCVWVCVCVLLVQHIYCPNKKKSSNQSVFNWSFIYIYIYIYILCVCVCVCVCVRVRACV